MKTNIFLMFFLLSAPLFGQVSLTATVSKNKVNTEERFTLSVTVSNCDGKNFGSPTLSDFYIVGGPNQSSQFSSINGKVSRSVSYNYVLQAKKAGKFTIGAASVQCDGETLTSQPITIEVTDAPVTQNNSSSGSSSSSQNTDLAQYAKENLFVRAEVSDADVYKGEQIIVTYKIYEANRSSILKWGPTANPQIPKFDGFYTEDITPQSQLPGNVTLNGIGYTTQILKQYKLTAQTAGDITIEPLKFPLAAAIQVKSKKKSNSVWDIFGDNFPSGYSYEQVDFNAVSAAVKIKVHDLPDGAPADFNGAVGNFSMQTELNATETQTDEPLTYKIKISGDGNLSLFEAPELQLPPGWETYEPEVEEAGSSRTFSYLLIPRSPGEFSIPAHTWSYFSPEKKQYISLASVAYKVNVEAAPGYTGTATSSGVNKEDVQLLAQDIRFIHKNNPVFLQEAVAVNPTVFYSAISLPFVFGIFLFLYAGKKNKRESDVVAMKNRKATSVAKKRLKKASEFAKEKNSKAFHDETIKALWGYLSDKFNIPQSELSKENISGILQKHQVQQETSATMLNILNECEMAIFAPQPDGGNLQETYAQAVHIIAKLEEEIKK